MLIHNAVITGSLVLPSLLPLTGSLTMTGSIGINVPNPATYGGVGLVVSGSATNSIAKIAMTVLGPGNGLNIGDDGTDAVIGPLNSGTKTHILSRAGGVYTRALTVDSDGNSSFGGASLNTAGDASTITIKQASTVAANGIYLERSGERTGYYMYVGGALDSLNFRRNYAGTKADVMSLTRDGNVGIGIVSPSQPLHVYATSTTTSTFFETNAANSYIGLKSTSGTNYIGNVSYNMAFEAGGAERMRITSGGIIYALNSGVDGTYQPMIGGMYSSNNNETNLISTSVSSVATQSGFRFDVSNGAGSTARTTSMTINRASVSIVGALSKGSGTFKIDHPLESKKDTHHLVHSFIEGPKADLIYRGKVTLINGTATINIDESVGMTEGTFAALNRDVQCFTTNESGWDLIKGKVEGNILTITSQNTESTDEISWMVIGERKDQHMFDTEWTDENGRPILEPLKPVVPPSTEEDNSTEENNPTEE